MTLRVVILGELKEGDGDMFAKSSCRASAAGENFGALTLLLTTYKIRALVGIASLLAVTTFVGLVCEIMPPVTVPTLGMRFTHTPLMQKTILDSGRNESERGQSNLLSKSLVDTPTEPIQVTRKIMNWAQLPDRDDLDGTEQIMQQIRRNGTLPCHNVRTQTARVRGLPRQFQLEGQQERLIRLDAGKEYEVLLVSIGDDGKPRCAGGDFFETDLSGPRWKSRPPVVDHNNGTYSVLLQVDPRFYGEYTFKVVLLFSNFHALHHRPLSFARMEEVAKYKIEFVLSNPKSYFSSSRQPSNDPRGRSESNSTSSANASLPHNLALHKCGLKDFTRKEWSGRWTREKFNEDCDYDPSGRWQCVDSNLQCQQPWCSGPVGSLESNGWVYSAHCAFKIFQREEAWQCLDGRWLFFWGDSNHIDTVRNLLKFFLGFDDRIEPLEYKRMDTTFVSPENNRSSLRITAMYNGHWNKSKNNEGLNSLRNREYADLLRSFFTADTAPDAMVMNSGLHDGRRWKKVDEFLRDGVEFAAEFWADVWSGMRARRPDILYRTTVAAAGAGRGKSFNPHKMEVYNRLMVDRFARMELERFSVVDGFDYTFPWHWDHKNSDGVHYGRPPSRTKWPGNNVGHRYFVDLMLVHMLLNVLCAPPNDAAAPSKPSV